MGRSPCCEKKLGLKKGPWTLEEDQKLVSFIDQHGHGSWSVLPAKASLQRCGKSCRLRWNNYLRPDIKRGKVSSQEEQTIVQLHALLGNRWSTIAAYLPNRTDNEIKNYWNTHLKKRLTKMGIDPVTHKPSTGTLCATANLSHMAQWESARLQAEARLVRESKRFSSSNAHKNTAGAAAPPPPCLDVLRAWQLAQLAKPPPGGDHHLTAGTTPAVQNDATTHRIDHGVTNINIPILPFNSVDVAFLDGTGNIAWYENENDAVLKHAADVFSDFNSVGENHGTAATGHHGTGFFGEEDKSDHWSNILMNLVTINASANSASTSPSGAVFQ